MNSQINICAKSLVENIEENTKEDKAIEVKE